MSKTLMEKAGRHRSLQSLIELVEALDRRVPRPLAADEARIAADSAQLRSQAGARIQTMRREAVEVADAGRAQEVMTDDGAPVRPCPDCEDLV